MKYFIFILLLTAVPSFAEDGSGTPIFGSGRESSDYNFTAGDSEPDPVWLNYNSRDYVWRWFDGKRHKGVIHKNGGGFKGLHTKVDASVYIGKDSAVLDYATVLDNARISGNVIITGFSKVIHNAQVSDYSRISDKVIISGNAKVSGHSQISGDSVVYGNAEVSGSTRISDNAQVYGNAKLTGLWVRVSGNARVSGDTKLSGHIRLSGSQRVSSNRELTSEITEKWDNFLNTVGTRSGIDANNNCQPLSE